MVKSNNKIQKPRSSIHATKLQSFIRRTKQNAAAKVVLNGKKEQQQLANLNSCMLFEAATL